MSNPELPVLGISQIVAAAEEIDTALRADLQNQMVISAPTPSEILGTRFMLALRLLDFELGKSTRTATADAGFCKAQSEAKRKEPRER